MRASILILTMFISGAANAHPLEGAVRNLAKAAAELESGARTNKNADVAKKAGELRLRASALWLESVVVPISIGDEKMKSLGFYLANVNGGPAEFYIAKSEAADQATEELMNLNSSRWLELGNLIRKQQADVAELTTIVERRDQLTGIEEKDRKRADFQTMRPSALNQFRQFVEQASSCAEYFKKTLKASGLMPEKSGSGYAWLPNELKRVYGSSSIDAMSSEQKEQIRLRLEELSAKAYEFDHACISIEQSTFFGIELGKLGKK